MTTTAPIPVIQPDGIYDDQLLGTVLDLSPQVLANARRTGELRFSRKGKRTLYLGRWVLDWIKGERRPHQPPQRAEGSK